jgi:hypothetical protein
MGKKSRPGSGKKIPNHISESLETIFWEKVHKFFDADADAKSGSGNLFDPVSRIRDGKNSDLGDKHPGSATLLPNATF